MTRAGRIELDSNGLKRIKLIQDVIDGRMTQTTAASMLRLSCRQRRRLIARFTEEGPRGLVHKSRGCTSGRKTPQALKDRALSLYKGKYHDFGPTLAAEKLSATEGLEISRETLRKWLIEAGLWNKRSRKQRHRQWRQRRECFGQRVQRDGSHHAWLEDRGPELVLRGYIDDATNEVFGRFYDYEGTRPAMDSFKRYVQKYGLPMSVYLDRHTTYKSTRRLTPEEELEGIEEPRSQFERALEELGVEVIHALSPQAKGRVERLFGTLQDRLVKELRLRGISTKDGANGCIEECLAEHNRRFKVCAANAAEAPVRVGDEVDLEDYLCLKTKRSVGRDNTVAHSRRLYQIEEANGRKVTVQERLDGEVRIVGAKKRLRLKETTKRPVKEAVAVKKRSVRKTVKPAAEHPWRRGS